MLSDGQNREAIAASVGWLFVRRISRESHRAWRVRRSGYADRAPGTALEKTVWSCSRRWRSGWYDRRVRQVRVLSSAGFRIVLELEVRRVACRSCGTVKRERLELLADNAHFTKRFAFYVGRRCRQASIRHGAQEIQHDWAQ